MGLGHLAPDDPIFENEDVIRDDDEYQPDELVSRDEELNEYLQKFKPVIKGNRPRNIFLYGKTGVGKTVATGIVLDRLKEDAGNYDHVSVETFHLECKNFKTSYQVAANLVNEFRADDDQIATTGLPSSMVYNKLYRHLRDLDVTHAVIVLDEIDSIGNDDDILYNLPRCNNNGNVPSSETKVGVVGISNSFTFVDNLSARVQDTLCDEEILFKPYNANQLQKILYQRAEEAFVGVTTDDNGDIDNLGVLEEGVIPLISAVAASESGSARDALDLLYKTGDNAREEGRDIVTESDVRNAQGKVEKGHIKEELRSLPTQSKLVMWTVLKLQEAGHTPIRSKDIHRVYKPIAAYVDVDPLALRSMRRRISDLVVRDFLNFEETNKGHQAGSYRRYDIGDLEDELIRKSLMIQRDGKSDNQIADLEFFDAEPIIRRNLRE